MAAGDYTEKGTVVDVGVLGFASAVAQIIRCVKSPMGTVTNILGDQGSVIQRIITNPGFTVELEAYILRNNLNTVLGYKVGDAVTLSTPTANTTYMCTASKVTITPAGAAVWSFSGEDPDSLTPA